MRIALVLTDMDYGGAEVQVVKLAKSYGERNHEVAIISLMPMRGLQEQVANSGALFFDLNLTSANSLIPAALKYIKLIKSFNPDVIHAHMYHANIFSRLCQLFFGNIPLVNTSHSYMEGGDLRMLIYRVTRYIPHICTGVSEASVGRLINIGAFSKTTSLCVYNGIESFNSPINYKNSEFEREGFNWLAVGRLVEDKDYWNLFHACSVLRKKCPDLNFNVKVLGGGYLMEELKTAIAHMELGDNIELIGHTNNVAEYMVKADAYVMSSKSEGLPMTLLEASNQRLAAVVTDVGGNKEVIIHEKGGFVVKPGDPQQLAMAMEKMMRLDSKARQIMGDYNLNRAQQVFALDRIVDTWIQIYCKLIGSKRKA